MKLESPVMESTVEAIEDGRPMPIHVGKGFVGPIGILLITAYLTLFSSFLLYCLVRLWPPPLQPDETSSSVIFLFWQFPIANEIRLFILVALAGALGSLVHALRSLYWYVGNRELVWSWVLQYVMLPFIGGTLGVVFYVVVRGGFFSPQATMKDISPFGFAALAGLVGLFSDQAMEKLKQVATTMLAEAPKGKDQVPPRG